MKNIIGVILLSLVTVAAVSCGDDDDTTGNNKLRLSHSELSISVLDSRVLNISGGSGDYTAQISDPAVAAVWVGEQDKGTLHITPIREGAAVVTVGDGSGDKVTLGLTVTLSVNALTIVSWNAEVEAADEQAQQEISDDVLAETPLPVDYSYVFTFSSRTAGDLSITEDGSEVFAGTFTSENGVYTLKYDDKTYVYSVEVITAEDSRANMPSWNYERKVLLKEDLTEHYREMYPESEVTKVLRIQACKESEI